MMCVIKIYLCPLAFHFCRDTETCLALQWIKSQQQWAAVKISRWLIKVPPHVCFVAEEFVVSPGKRLMVINAIHVLSSDVLLLPVLYVLLFDIVAVLPIKLVCVPFSFKQLKSFALNCFGFKLIVSPLTIENPVLAFTLDPALCRMAFKSKITKSKWYDCIRPLKNLSFKV